MRTYYQGYELKQLDGAILVTHGESGASRRVIISEPLERMDDDGYKRVIVASGRP